MQNIWCINRWPASIILAVIYAGWTSKYSRRNHRLRWVGDCITCNKIIYRCQVVVVYDDLLHFGTPSSMLIPTHTPHGQTFSCTRLNIGPTQISLHSKKDFMHGTSKIQKTSTFWTFIFGKGGKFPPLTCKWVNLISVLTRQIGQAKCLTIKKTARLKSTKMYSIALTLCIALLST